mgnify:CR=1 FL=1
MEILSETRISQQVITRIGRIPLTRRPLELGPHRPPGEIRITTLELGNIELRPIDLDSRTVRPAPRRRLPRPRAELWTSNLIIRMLIQILLPTDLTNTRRRLINITPRISRIPCRSLEFADLIPVVTRKAEVFQSVFLVGGIEVAPGAAFGHMRIEPCFRVVTCLYVAGAVFEQLGNGLVMVGRPAIIGARLVRIGMVMVSTVAVIVVVHRVIVRSVPVGISGSIGITSSIRRVVLLRRIQSPGLIGPRALGTGVLRLTALGAAVVAGPSRRVTATRTIRALVGPGPRTMSPTGMRMRGRATQPVGMRSTTKSMSSTSPRHTQPSRTSHSSTSRMSRRRTPTMRPTGLISRRTAPTPTGMTGSIGLRPTLAALKSGAQLALANKESLVAGGALVADALARPGQIVPVDSEHSAIAQALASGRHRKGLTSPVVDGTSEVRRLILTASGGPFRGRTRADLEGVTPEQALKHPTWSMGPVVTVNSSTLVNKALELIEAAYLFDVDPQDIVPVVHPQSVVHSMVEFQDGSTIAQASPPDMRLPISLGLSWPDRLADVAAPNSWDGRIAWTFEPLDSATFPAVDLARRAVAASPLHPAVFNAANEECVEAFLNRRLGYPAIVETVAKVMAAFDAPSTFDVDAVLGVETWARARAHELMGV